MEREREREQNMLIWLILFSSSLFLSPKLFRITAAIARWCFSSSINHTYPDISMYLHFSAANLFTRFCFQISFSSVFFISVFSFFDFFLPSSPPRHVLFLSFPHPRRLSFLLLFHHSNTYIVCLCIWFESLRGIHGYRSEHGSRGHRCYLFGNIRGCNHCHWWDRQIDRQIKEWIATNRQTDKQTNR